MQQDYSNRSQQNVPNSLQTPERSAIENRIPLPVMGQSSYVSHQPNPVNPSINGRAAVDPDNSLYPLNQSQFDYSQLYN